VNSAIRRSIAKLVGRTGYHVLSEWRLREWDFARHVRELFARQQIDLVLDVGANVGQYRDFLREQVEYDGWIVSFEPLEDNVAVLSSRATADPKWVIHDADDVQLVSRAGPLRDGACARIEPSRRRGAGAYANAGGGLA
jgi:hypothetical protein